MARTVAVYFSICCLAAAVSFASGAIAYGCFCVASALVGRFLGKLLDNLID